jgi:hypothetical protein
LVLLLVLVLVLLVLVLLPLLAVLALLVVLVLRSTAGLRLVAVAPGPEEREARVACVLTVKLGLPVGV